MFDFCWGADLLPIGSIRLTNDSVLQVLRKQTSEGGTGEKHARRGTKRRKIVRNIKGGEDDVNKMKINARSKI
jgi:hypothetical protein